MPGFKRPGDTEIPLPRLRSISQLWSLAAVLSALGVAAMAIDVPLANWARSESSPRAFQKLCSLSEIFGHGVGVAAILLLIAVIDPRHRYALPRIAAAALGSGLLANALKLFVARDRPYHFDFSGPSSETFLQWFPMLSNSSGEQSFPSSHVATAAGLAIVLARYYPRGRWLFPVFAALAGCQRVLEEAHFLSDVFWGATVGCIFAPLCIYGSRLSGVFDRLEERLLRIWNAKAGNCSQLRAETPAQPNVVNKDASRAA